MKRRDPFWVLVALLCCAFCAVFFWGMRTASAAELPPRCITIGEAIETGGKRGAAVFLVSHAETNGATASLIFVWYDYAEVYAVVGNQVYGILTPVRRI